MTRYVDRGIVTTSKLRVFLYENPAYANMLKYLLRNDPMLWAQVKELKARFHVDENRWSYFTSTTGKRNGNRMVEVKQVHETSFIRVSPEPFMRDILTKVIKEAQE